MLTKQDLQDRHDKAIEAHARETRIDGIIQWAIYAGALGTIFYFPIGFVLHEMYGVGFLHYAVGCHALGQVAGIAYHRITGNFTPPPSHPGGSLSLARYLEAHPYIWSSHGNKRLAKRRKDFYYSSPPPISRRHQNESTSRKY